MDESIKWQYKVFVGWPEQYAEIPVGPDVGVLAELHSNEDSALEITLTELGEAGWELASALPTELDGRSSVFFILKRPALLKEGKPYY